MVIFKKHLMEYVNYFIVPYSIVFLTLINLTLAMIFLIHVHFKLYNCKCFEKLFNIGSMKSLCASTI